MQKQRPLLTGLSLLFLVLLLISLALRFWANDRAWQKSGPTHLAADAGQVYLYAGDVLYQLSFKGELQRQFSSEITGLADDPIDLRLSKDGQLLIAEQQPARIRSCNPTDWECRDVAAGLSRQLERQFKVLLTDPQHSMLVTDARGDTLWGTSGSGSEAQRLVPNGLLAGPNDLAFDASGHLWVADTDHRRIIELIPDADGVYQPGRQHSALNHLTVADRFYPMMLAAAPDGTWWVTQAAEFSDRYADLVLYDPDEGAIARVDLPGSVYSTDIAAAGKDMLVTDLEQFRVYRVNSDTHQVSEFGDAQFTGQLDELRAQKERYIRMSGLAMAAVLLFGILMVIAAVLSTPRHKRWTRQPELFDPATAAESVPRVSGVYWLQRNPVLDRSLKWFELVSFTAVILMIVAALGVYGWMLMQAGPDPGEELQAKLDELGLLLLIGGPIIAGVVPLVRYGTRALKHKLGTDGRHLYILLSDGRELVVPPAELAYTSQAILYRQYSMPLKTGKRQEIYLDGEVETWLAPLLRQAERLSPLQGLKHQFQNRDALLIWSLAGGVVLGLLLILMTLSGK